MASQDPSGVGELQALLGPGAQFEGTLVFQGRIRIEGRFKGEIRSEDVLIVGDAAEIDADIDVGALIVRGGSLRGAVRARQLVEIYAPGSVRGDIEAPQVFLEKGARFEGQCTMANGEPSAAQPEVCAATTSPSSVST
jgi:cytoskeletal protein CcmA (bactofilin family)